MEKAIDEIIKTYTVSELLERYTQLLSENKRLVDENKELRRQLENKETSENKEISETITKPLQPDYEEVKDENDRIWYKRTHFRTQRKESRQLEKYDIIVTKNKFDDPVPDIFMIDSFDYNSDFAARSLYGKHIFYIDVKRSIYNTSWYGGCCPCNTYFSFATEDEIKELFDNMKKNEYEYKIILRNEKIAERYSEYLD